jgi:hypothetical protein
MAFKYNSIYLRGKKTIKNQPFKSNTDFPARVFYCFQNSIFEICTPKY